MDTSGNPNYNTTDGELSYRVAFEKLVTSISTSFINLSLDEIDSGIVGAMKSVCEYTGYDRSYVILRVGDGKTMETAYEWCADGIQPHSRSSPDHPVNSISWFSGAAGAQTIVQLEDLQELRAEAGLSSSGDDGEQIRSILLLPLSFRGEPMGILGFDAVRSPKQWPEETTAWLNIVGEIIVNTLQRKRAEVALRDSYQTLELRVEERTREIERRRRVAESLRDMVAVLNSNLSLDEILEQIVAQAVNLLDTDAVALYRLREREKVLVIRASYGFDEDAAGEICIPAGKGIAGHAILSRRPVAVSDSAVGTRRNKKDVDLLSEERAVTGRLIEEYRAFLSVPLVGQDEIYGAITLYYREVRSFTQEEIELAASFAGQAALAIMNARLRSQREQDAVLMERNRLARDLHDAVTQTLFSASLIADVLPRLWERNPEEARRRVEELRELSRGALAEMRMLLLELRPSALTEVKLSDLLKQLADAVNGRARLPVMLSVNGDVPLVPDVQVALYRISQEALNNIIKHSGATRVEISLQFHSLPGSLEQQVDLSIQDNGRGFDPRRVPPEHLGLGIMRERAQSIHAALQIESEPGKGTRIAISWRG